MEGISRFITSFRLVWWKFTGKTFRIRIYLKSGSILEIDVSKFNWKSEGSKIISAEWKAYYPEILQFIDLDQIEAITQI